MCSYLSVRALRYYIELVSDGKRANSLPSHTSLSYVDDSARARARVYLRRRDSLSRKKGGGGGETVNPQREAEGSYDGGSHAVAMDTVVSQMAAIHSASQIIPIPAEFSFFIHVFPSSHHLPEFGIEYLQ